MILSIIAAVAENGVIGRKGELPWRLASDLKRFRELTIGKTVIVGRKTHEAIMRRLGHPLEGRRTIVVTRNLRYQSECEIARSLEEAVRRAKPADEVFVIGGAELYRLALPIASRLIITHVHASPHGDATFPPWERNEWEATFPSKHPSDAENDHDSTLVIYERKSPYSFVNLENARYDDQWAVMERIARAGVCPFCPADRARGKVLNPVWQGEHWSIVPNRWPYKFTTLHLMAIAERHVRMLSELTPEEWAELRELIAWAEAEYRLDGGAIGIRFGDPRKNGATVDHLHVHLIVADPDVTKPGYERVRFPMGPKPPEQKKTPDA